MMYFDFHAHAFTDVIAERAISSLTGTAHNAENPVIQKIRPCTDGTVNGLLKIMDSCGIEKALVLPIATKPSQQTTINDWAAAIMNEKIYCCGTVHPDAENISEELERIKSLGLYGVKFHSEYQKFRPDEERMMPIYKKIAGLGLVAVFHGGYDPLSGKEILATPESFANVAEKIPGLKIVAAHLGGMFMFDDVEKYIVGKFENIYLDVSMTARFIDRDQLLKIIENHGVDRILFGSDVPWDNPQNEIDMINSLPLSDGDKEKIFFENAERILKI